MATPSGATPRDLVLLAHGSPDPRHAQGVAEVAERVRSRSHHRVHTAYLDHHLPTPADVATDLHGGVLVPLLLTRAHHVKVDVPGAGAAMNGLGRGVYAVAGALGPDELLFRACDELLAKAGHAPESRAAVVLFAGGSSDRQAIAAIAARAAARVGQGWGPWTVAALAGGETVASATGRLLAGPPVERVLVVAYMVAGGVLRDRMVEQSDAAGATMVPGTLSETDSLAELVLRRADEAGARLGR